MNLSLPPLPPPPQVVRRLIERLPTQPPSMLLALALNRALLPKLDAPCTARPRCPARHVVRIAGEPTR